MTQSGFSFSSTVRPSAFQGPSPIDPNFQIASSFVYQTTPFSDPGLLFNVACFRQGTRLRTPAGWCAVEDLAIGDVVILRDGTTAPVKWLGWRTIDCRRHPRPRSVWPVPIAPHAFGPGRPARDLFLSPDHAIFTAGRLVPAYLLVNGATILRETDCRRVTYHHIELETHDILLAEGAPSESYLDTGNRWMFENTDAPLILHPLFEDGQEGRIARSCAPFLDDAAVLEPLWRGLAERAAMLGYPVARPVLTDDAAPRIAVGGRELRPVSVRGDVHTFMVPAGVETIRLLSHATAPSEVTPWVGDSRALGLAVWRIRVTEGAVVTDVALDHPGLTDGWWALEVDAAGTRRWTSGDAVLPVGPGGMRVLQITAGRMAGYVAATHGAAGTQALAA